MSPWLNSKAVEKLHADLDEIPKLYLDLPAILTGLKTGGSGVHYPPGSKPPLSIQVVALLDTRLKNCQVWLETDPRTTDTGDRYGVIPTIGLWARSIDDDLADAGEVPLGLDGDDWGNIATLCAAIKRATGWIIEQQWATEFADDIHGIRSELNQALGIRPEFIPKCRYCRNVTVPQDNGTWFRCPACGADFTWQAEVNALLAVQEMTGPQCAMHLGMGPGGWGRIRQWQTRGLVKTIGKDTKGRNLFSVDAVARVLRKITTGEISIKEA